MYQNQFDDLLRQGKKNSSYLFYGESDFLIDLYIQKTIDNLNICADEIQKIYFEDYDYVQVKNYLSQSSLFAENNFIIVKQNKKIDAKQMKDLVQVAAANPNSIIIFALYLSERLATHEKYFTNKTDGVVVRFFNPKPQQALHLLMQEAKTIGLDIAPDALSHLYTVHEENLSLCKNDLKKLYILNTPIGMKHISKYCSSLGDVSLDKFLHKLLENQNVHYEIEKIFQEGVAHIQLLSQISAFIQQLFMIYSYSKTHGFADPIEILGYKPPADVWKRKSVLASKIKLQQYLQMMQYYQEIELELKTNKDIDSSSFFMAKLRKHSVVFR